MNVDDDAAADEDDYYSKMNIFLYITLMFYFGCIKHM